MRLPIILALAALLAGCTTPSAQPPEPAPATATPAEAGPAGTTAPVTTASPQNPAAPVATATPVAPPATAQPTAEQTAAELPDTLGYGQALSAVFVSGADALAVGTSGGVLLLRLPDLSTLRFIPLDGAVEELTVSPGGQYLAATSYSMARATTRLLSTDGVEQFAIGGNQALFSQDAGLIAVSEFDDASSRNKTSIYRVGDGSLVATAPGDRPSFSAGSGGVIATFDREELVLTQVGVAELFRAPAYSVAFSPDTRFVAVAGFSGVELLALANGSLDESARRVLLQTPAQDLAFTEGGELLAITEGGIVRWDLAGGGEPAVVSLDLGADMGLFGPGGHLLALTTLVGDAPSTLRLVRADDGSEVYADAQFEGGRAFFSPDGRQAAVVTSAGFVRLLDLEQGAGAERRLAGYSAVAFHQDGGIVAGRPGPEVDFWPAEGGEEPTRTLGTFDLMERLRELSSTGEGAVAEVEQQALGGFITRLAAVRLTWDAQGPSVGNATVVPELTLALPAVWDWEGGQIVWATPEGVVLLSDGGGEPRTLPVPAGVPTGAVPTSLALSPDGGRLALGYGDGTLLVVQTADFGPVASGPLGEGEAITALTWSGDGRVLAFALAGGEVAVWEAGEDDGARRFAAPAEEFGPPQLALSADGAVLAAGGSGGMVVYDVAGGTELLREELHADDVGLSADGARAAAAVGGRVVLRQVR